MHTTGILSALAEEQRGLAERLQAAQRSTHAGREFVSGVLEGQRVVLVLSRIGKVAASTTAAALIERFGATRMLFTGVAGGMGPGVNVGDMVVADGFVQHDIDASPLFPRYEVPLYGQARFASDAALTAMLFEASNDLFAGASPLFDAETRAEFGLHDMRVHQGLMASGDQFIATTAASEALRAGLAAQGHAPLAVEMEGAAVAQVCLDYGVPFAAVRTISDRADDAAHVDFPRFIRAVASRYALELVPRWLARLP